MAFLPIVIILSTLTVSLAIQAYQTTTRQEGIKQAQLAAASAMEFAKEQYENDVNYMSTPETTLYTTDQYEVRFEVVHKGFSNGLNTQQDIQGVGRVYRIGDSEPAFTREIQGKITYTSGGTSSVRFVFIVDNSGSMSVSEWLQSKNTVDAAITYVVDEVPTAEVAVIQYGTNTYNQEHKYDVTVPFTRDITTATSWDRRYGPGSSASADLQDHLPASLARMRAESVYGPGNQLDLSGATDVQYVLFTDARGAANSGGCCSSLKKLFNEPSSWNTGASAAYPTLDNHDEYNELKNGNVFADDGYPDLTAQFTVLSINSDGTTPAISAAIASPGGSWTGVVDPNTNDPEGSGIIPRRFINTTLSAGPDEIILVLQEIIEEEINF